MPAPKQPQDEGAAAPGEAQDRKADGASEQAKEDQHGGLVCTHSGGSGTPLARRASRPEEAAAVAVFVASTEAA